MTDPRDQVPDPDQRAALNAALTSDGTDTGFWDDNGRPAPWPDDIDDLDDIDDIDEWRPATSQTISHQPAEQPH